MFQGQTFASTCTGVWHFEGCHLDNLLFYDALCWLLHDVPPHKRAVCHQALYHLQHAGGKAPCCCTLAGTQDFKSSSVEGVGRRMLAVASGKGASFTWGSWELKAFMEVMPDTLFLDRWRAQLLKDRRFLQVKARFPHARCHTAHSLETLLSIGFFVVVFFLTRTLRILSDC